MNPELKNPYASEGTRVAAIYLACEMEKLFRLYSYRIIGHEQFCEEVHLVVQETNKRYQEEKAKFIEVNPEIVN